jgi:hypothetical protein
MIATRSYSSSQNDFYEYENKVSNLNTFFSFKIFVNYLFIARRIKSFRIRVK